MQLGHCSAPKIRSPPVDPFELPELFDFLLLDPQAARNSARAARTAAVRRNALRECLTRPPRSSFQGSKCSNGRGCPRM